MLSFNELLIGTRGESWDPPASLLAIDPGETCGWALFTQGLLHSSGQIVIATLKDGSIDTGDLWDLIQSRMPNKIVIESYRVYASKVRTHTWSALYTPKLIGGLEAICNYHRISVTLQMASVKKFCSNDKLKAWGYYQKASPHALDAIRHGCYYLLFHERRKI